MKARKIVLLSLIAVLLCIYIVQVTSVTKGSVKQVTMTDTPDRIVLESAANGKIILTKKNETWFLGENQQYETLESEVNILLNAMNSYSILQTVSKGGDEILYGLDDDSKISVTAWKGADVLCQFDVGKDASTARQSFIRRAGEKEILLISDSFNNVFNVSADDIRVRSVYYHDAGTITQAYLITNDAGVIHMVRDNEGEWIGFINNEYQETMTSDSIESWISTIAILNAAGWLPDDWKPSAEAVGIIMFEMEDGTTIQDAIYPVEGEDRYIGTCSACPYAFYVSSYTKGKFLRTAADFAQ